VLGDPVDVSQDFQKMENVYFIGSRLASFDTATGQGTLQWDRYVRNTTLSFNKIDVVSRGQATEFPEPNTIRIPHWSHTQSRLFSPRALRLRLSTRAFPLSEGNSLIALAGAVFQSDRSWQVTAKLSRRSFDIVCLRWRSRIHTSSPAHTTLTPPHIEIYDQRGTCDAHSESWRVPPPGITPIPIFVCPAAPSDLSPAHLPPLFE
jgi:hypothetical protein